MADDIKVIFNNLYLYVPNKTPNVGTQVMFIEANQNNYKISFDEWYTERRVLSDTITQWDIGTSQHVNNPKYLIGSHQTRTRADTANKKNDIAIFENLNLQKYYVEIDSVTNPRDSVLVNYAQNDYIEKYRNFKLIFKEYFDEHLMGPFIFYPDVKTKYPVEIIDLGHQTDHITPKKIQLFLEYSADPENGKFNLILNRQREKELIKDGKKLIEVKVI